MGSKGALAEQTPLTSCSSAASPRALGIVTWSLESDGDVVLLCHNQTTTQGTTLLGTFNLCIEIDPAGTLGSKARVSFASPDLPDDIVIVTKNY